MKMEPVLDVLNLTDYQVWLIRKSINADTSRGSVLGYVGICLLLAAVGVVVFIFAVKKEKNDAFNAQLVNSYQAMNSNSEFDQMADNTTHDAGSGIDKDTFM